MSADGDIVRGALDRYGAGYGGDVAEVSAALNRLEARLAEVEKERDKAVEAQDWLANDAAEFNVRAEAAEARVVELEGALREIVDAKSYVNAAGYVHTGAEAQEFAVERARAVLAATEEKRA